MKIALINGSPKSKDSASEILLNDFKPYLTSDIVEFVFNTPEVSGDFIKDLNSFDALVFFFPLYSDAIPSHLLSCLCQLEDIGITNKEMRIYGVANNGFYEGIQNDVALEILENWSIKMGLGWGMGIGVGAGGALSAVKNMPAGKGAKTSLGIVFKELSEVIVSKSSSVNKYIQMNMPRFIYKALSDKDWKVKIKANGGKVKDIKNRL